MKHRRIVITLLLACAAIAVVVRLTLKSAPRGAAAIARPAPAKPPSATAAQSWQQQAHAALTHGRAWLLNQQQADGSWSDAQFPALSGLALLALSEDTSQAARQAADRGAAYILLCVCADGGIYVDIPERKGGGLSVYNTAICMSALHSLQRPEFAVVLQNARAFLETAQYNGGESAHVGGFGYDSSHQRLYTDLMNTHFAAEAMRLTQSVEDLRPVGAKYADLDWTSLARYTESLQAGAEAGAANRGGFVYNPLDPKAGAETNEQGRAIMRPYGSISYAGLITLLYAGTPPDDPRIRAVVSFISRNWSLTENPRMGDQGLYFYYNVMARALTLAGIDEITPSGATAPLAWRAALARQLLKLQRADGSWANDNNRFWEGNPVLATAYALHALQLTLK